MNPFDKSITQLDVALMRRFDHIQLRPSSETVASFLQAATMFTPEQVGIVTSWFDNLQNPSLLPFGIGHTYFKDVRTPEQLAVIWRHRMLPYCESVLELEPQKLENIKRMFKAMYARLLGQDQVGETP